MAVCFEWRWALLILVNWLACPAAVWSQSQPVVQEGVWHGVVARSSGRALDILGASADAGAAAVQWEFTQAASQQWKFVRVSAGSDWFRIEVRQSGKCLTVDKPVDSAPVVQRPYSGGVYQQWKLVAAGPAGSMQVVNRGNEFCLAVAAPDKNNGVAVVAQRYLGRATQQWRVFPLQLHLADNVEAYGKPMPLGPGVNTAANELHPVLSADSKTLYFVRTRFAGNTEGVAESGDIWVSQTTDNGQTWSPATRLDALNTPQHNGVQAVLAGGDALLVRGQYQPRDGTSRDEGVSRAGRTSRGWSKPVAQTIENYYSTGTSTTFFETADEKALLMSLERADGQGGNDIYVSLPNGNGSWGEPRSLGPQINSPGFEFAPWLTPDGKTLYFASYGHAGYGGADIFVSQRLDDSWNQWSAPRNLGPNINGPGFDAYLQLSADGKQAYFATARTLNGPADIVRAATDVVPDSAKPVAAVPAAPSRGIVRGRVLDASNRKPIAAEVKANRLGGDIVFNATGRSEAAGGSFQFTLVPGRYRVVATAPGFLTATDTVGVSGSLTYDVLLVPAAVGAKLELPTLIFAQGKSNLLPASYAELNRLARTLSDNPAVRIRLEGHTDNVGPADKNQQLSEERVAEVRRYLVSRGVAEERIATVGYGGSRPRASNEQEETRKLNRRVEFTITK
ncbi:OmpA family protein [Hymenobacter busanensis]|uniref:OmpA family protein n=1 Tax=Hymenobacter busanensis TaxID=2607656 RepID=A0A7L4ZVD5_9BACT|nr:OmpA family protein [Hymenobacter busanensis]KAA9339080.1 OmpA family protein [Hymenobacter busanensis]QHJ07158.1 OmpA family protein [Hymenobacter busanensis]